MAKFDVKVVEPKGASTRQYQVQDRTSSSETDTVKAGEPVKLAAAGSPYVIPLATGDPEIGTDLFVGIAAGESTETSSADGTVDVIEITPNTILEAKATTSTNVNTQAKIDALVGDTVCFDFDNTNYTIDENEGDDDNVHALRIVGGDPDKETLQVKVKWQATDMGAAI